LNDNIIKGLISLLVLNRKLSLLHTLVDYGIISIYRFNKKANLVIFHILFK
jgi:hypothetical protein